MKPIGRLGRHSRPPRREGPRRAIPLLIGALVALLLALTLSACGGSGGSTAETTAAAAVEEPAGGATEAAGEESAPVEGEATNEGSGVQTGPIENVKLVVKSDEEHGKKGSDGNWHDAFLPADFSVKAGATVHVTVYNYDDSAHSFTSSELGTDTVIAGGDENRPSKTTFTFQAPGKPGTYEWHCAVPCDEWAMVHYGYMKGKVTVT